MKIAYDYKIFWSQKYGGISRYFLNLHKELTKKKIDTKIIIEEVKKFKPLPHRLEFIVNLKGTLVYNDSKATNLSATVAAIESIDKKEIKPSQIDLSNEINKIGSYKAKINLHAEILADIHIEVVKEKDEN